MPNDTTATILLILALCGAFFVAYRLALTLTTTGRGVSAAEVADELADIAEGRVFVLDADAKRGTVGLETDDLYIWVDTKGERILDVSIAQSKLRGEVMTYTKWLERGKTPIEILRQRDPQIDSKLAKAIENAVNAALDARKVVHY